MKLQDAKGGHPANGEPPLKKANNKTAKLNALERNQSNGPSYEVALAQRYAERLENYHYQRDLIR